MGKKSVILTVIISLLLIGIVGIYFISKMNKTDTQNNYKIVDVNFGSLPIINVDLNTEEGVFKVKKAGVYKLSGTLNGNINIDTLDNVKLVLNNVTINSTNGPAIYVYNARNVHIEVLGQNSLNDSKDYSNYDPTISGCIFSHDDIFIYGTGQLNIIANHGDGIVSKDDVIIENLELNIKSVDDGIRGKDSVLIKSGTIAIDSLGDGIKSTNIIEDFRGNVVIENGIISINSSRKGISAVKNITIKNGTLKVVSIDDAFNANNITIENGSLDLESNDDALRVVENLLIQNGNITVKNSYEGFEAENVTINSGIININSIGDGINCSLPAITEKTTSNVMLTINGGNINVNALADGLDSNGSILINGGNVVISSPNDEVYTVIDYDGKFEINGGTVIASGNFDSNKKISETSKQYIVLLNLSEVEPDDIVSIEDLSYKLLTDSSYLMISTPNFELNKNYEVKLNNKLYKNITLSSKVNKR